MIKHLSATSSPDEVCAALNDDGCCVVDNVVRPEVMDQVAAELRPFTDATAFGAEPNTQVSTVDAAFPGMLPVINKHCVEQAVKI